MHPDSRQYHRSQQPVQHKRVIRKGLLSTLIVLAAGVLLFVFFESHHAGPGPKSQQVAQTGVQGASDGFDAHQYSLTDPSSIWVLVNKRRPLTPKNYAPADLTMPSVPLRVPGNESMQLRAPTARALEQLFAAAKTDNINLMLSSGYRSYTYQVNLYNGYVKTQGQAQADNQSARPGYSEHQTGLAADVEPASRNCEVDSCFGGTPEGKWIAANAYKYGFIVRYTADKQQVTGYEPEPWHIRYIGVSLATELHKQNIKTLEEFFDTGAAPNYSS
jgi:zinc D-Ala-D-Ala carboxypeptidase